MKYKENEKIARERKREMDISFAGMTTFASLAAFSEYYLQEKGLPAFTDTVRVLNSIIHNPEWSYRIASTLLAYGGDVGLPVTIFFFFAWACAGAEFLGIKKTDREGQKFRSDEELRVFRLKFPLIMSLIIASVLFLSEFADMKKGPSQEHGGASGFDKFDLLSFSTVYIATFLYALSSWARSQKKQK